MPGNPRLDDDRSRPPWVGFARALVLAASVVGTSLPGQAAELTDIADAADIVNLGTHSKPDLFDLYMGVDFEMEMANGKITREPIDRLGLAGEGCSKTNVQDCLPVDELRWKGTVSKMKVKTQIGMYHDLAFTGGWTYIFSESRRFHFARGVDGTNSTVAPTTDFNGDGQVDADDVLFPADFSSRHKGSGALDLGLRWAPLSDERDESKPMWVLLFNWRTPWTAKTYNPEKRTNPGPVGDGVHRLTFGTALSKRLANVGLIGIDPRANRRGFIDPYLELSYTLPIPQRSRARPDLLRSRENPFGHKPSHEGELKIGFEVVPLEDLKNSRKIAIDIGLLSRYHTEGRNYSVLTDPLGELNFTEQFIHVGGRLGLYAQAAEFIRLKVGVGFGYNSEHFLTNEEVGRDANQDGQVLRPDDDDRSVKDQLNQYFCGNVPHDPENGLQGDGCTSKRLPPYDQVGYRFKSEEYVVFTWFVALLFTF